MAKMAGGIFPVLPVSTVLSGLSDAEPLSEEESQKLRDDLHKEWRERTLQELLIEALLDKNFGHTLCEEVGHFFRDDKAPATALKEAATGGRGRAVEWNLASYHLLLMAYAFVCVETKGDHGSTLNLLVEWHQRMTGNILSPRVIDNKISAGIKELAAAGQLDEVLNIAEWVRDAIENRIEKGRASTKRLPTTPKPRSPK